MINDALLPHQPLAQVRALLSDGSSQPEWVAEETPVALVYNGISHAVMMATPADLEDFALGFSLSEGLLAHAGELLDIETEAAEEGISLQLRVTAACEARLKERRRTLAGRTGCGLCGIDSLRQVRLDLPSVKVPAAVDTGAIRKAMASLPAAQVLNARCGGVHAATWCAPDGGILLAREDVGRHNALDKLVGAVAGAGLDPQAGFVAVSSRASFEMVQKTLVLRASLLASVSAPTAMAIRVAQSHGLALVSFVRADRATRYA
jgi:FdhD protein